MKKKENTNKIKEKLSIYKDARLIFTKHAEDMLVLRNGNKKKVRWMLTSDKLFYCESEIGKRGDKVYTLYFQISNTLTMKLPVIFKKERNKSIIILTYIMTHRNWRNIIKR